MRTKVREFVDGGGGFVGIELGAYYASSNYEDPDTDPLTPGSLDLFAGDYEAWEDLDPTNNILDLYDFDITESAFGGLSSVRAFMSAWGGRFTSLDNGETIIVNNQLDPADPVAICFTGIWDDSSSSYVGTGRVVLTSLELSLRADDETGLLDWTIWDNWVATKSHTDSVNAWKLLGRMIDWADGDDTPEEPTITSSNPSGGQKVAVISTYDHYFLSFANYIPCGAFPGLIPAVGRSIENAGHIPLAIRFADVISNRLTFPDFTAVVFPGGNAYGYSKGLSGNETKVTGFVNDGGGYLGICAGSYYAADDITLYRCPDVGGSDTWPYPLDLFVGGMDTGPHYDIADFGCPNYEWALTDVLIEDEYLGFDTPLTQKQFYYGGGSKTGGTDVTTVVKYQDPSVLNEANAIRFEYGYGRVLLVGTHPEVWSGSNEDWLYWDNYAYDSGTPLNNPDNPWEFIDAALNRWLLPIGKGLAWLRENQSPDGSWNDIVGLTALATLAFLNADFTEANAVVSDGIGFLLDNVKGDGGIYNYYGNYDTSLAILALKATNNSDYNDEISAAATYLTNIQSDDASCPCYGGWGYSALSKNAWSDLSNSQFTAMALDAAEASGAPVDPAVWTDFLTFLKRVQNLYKIDNTVYNDMPWAFNRYDGGFNYNPDFDIWNLVHNSYGGMTAAGIWSLRLSGVEVADSRVQAALGWLEAQEDLTFNDNPIPAPDPLPDPGGPYDGYNTNRYYYYMCFAKAMAMCFLSQDDAGNPWYSGWQDALASKIASEQDADGSWDEDNQGQMVDTLWALLTLQTQQPPPAQLWMSIIIESPADLLVYDPQGRVCKEGEGECHIPGAEFIIDGEKQIVNLHEVEPGNYRFVFIGTEDGTVHLTVNKYRNDEIINTIIEEFDILPNQVFESDVLVSSLIGALTIMVEKPELDHIIVDTDIKPGSDPNCIKVSKKGVTPVAILSTSTIDLINIDVSTIEIDDDDPITPGVSPVKNSLKKDVNEDGLPDLVVHFSTPELYQAGLLDVDGNTLFITGELIDDTQIIGSDVFNLAGGPYCFD
jgi:glutamine amidotransferase-like uncharacterized protein